MATLKWWKPTVTLHSTAAYGGTGAVLAADQGYDYSSNVNLDSYGDLGAQIDLAFRGARTSVDQAFDDLIVAVFASLDGSNFDTIPYWTARFKADGTPQRFTFIVEKLVHFRIGIKTAGTNTTFQYKLTYRTWNETSQTQNSPSVSPSISPSASPSISPSVSPSVSPSASPSSTPSVSPSSTPSVSPSASPSSTPSVSPSSTPSVSPSASPSISPSVSPSSTPSVSPSSSPSA